MEDYGDITTYEWKRAFTQNRREVSHVFVTLPVLRSHDGICTYMINNPTLEIVSILMLAIEKPKIMRRRADNSTHYPNDRNSNLAK